MNYIRKLAGQTAVYGLSSIVGRLLNYLLVPLFTRVFTRGEYGVVTEMYAYVAFFIVILTYGMETSFFRFSESENKTKVYHTTLSSLLISTAVFLLLSLGFSSNIASVIQTQGHDYQLYIQWLAVILAFDALTAIPFARLRQQNRPLRFALVKLSGIVINIGLNLFFIFHCLRLWELGERDFFGKSFFDPSIGVGYIFIANLISSGITLLLLLPEWRGFRFQFNKKLWNKMIRYSWPLLIFGLAGIVNETIDRVMLKYLLPHERGTNMEMLGIYGACYKISILMTIFIQAFRYAAEPFFFAQSKLEDAREKYAAVMKYFIILSWIIFLGVIFNLPWIKYFIGTDFREGLFIVPILLLANLFLGVFYNLSVWYKLTDKTKFGALISIAGAGLTILLNWLLIPKIGYEGAAWATLACYAFMTILSLIAGRRYYPIPYPWKRIGIYSLTAGLLYLLSLFTETGINYFDLLLKNAYLLLFIGLVIVLERPKKVVI